MQIERKHVDSQRHVGPLGAHLGAMLYLRHAKTNAKEPCMALDTELEATWAPCRASWGQCGGHVGCLEAGLGGMVGPLGADLGAVLELLAATLGPCWSSWARLRAMLTPTEVDAMLDLLGPTRRPMWLKCHAC